MQSMDSRYARSTVNTISESTSQTLSSHKKHPKCMPNTSITLTAVYANRKSRCLSTIRSPVSKSSTTPTARQTKDQVHDEVNLRSTPAHTYARTGCRCHENQHNIHLKRLGNTK
ncbi:hypothetical protein KC19_VG229600 [Ceratodon purpureus]|uniref:Uncharacterized protein n=1 Tax=Ceratodon purpureus TaxID=3225 RepID=A0A8T0HTB6_CERPU|nr:hypothetical protein KC19_VG229600 [Ceratodon purpureus]